MPEYAITFSALLQRPSPIDLTRRNIRTASGDDFVVLVNAYADEDASTPADLTNATCTMFLYRCANGWSGWDYGWFEWDNVNWRDPVLSVVGLTATDALPFQVPFGQTLFQFQPPVTGGFHGRYAFAVHIATQFAMGATVIRGVMDIERGPVTPYENTTSGTEFTLDDSDLDGGDILG